MKERQLRETYAWYIDKLVAMGALSKQEQEEEFIFLHPMANGLKNAMKKVIKTKIKSALCDEETMKEADAQMFVDNPDEIQGAARSVHKDIPPAEFRIRQYKTKQFKQFNDAIRSVREEDAKLIQQRETQDFKRGILTANLGSQFDIPAHLRDDKSVSTAATTKIMSTTDKNFR